MIVGDNRTGNEAMRIALAIVCCSVLQTPIFAQSRSDNRSANLTLLPSVFAVARGAAVQIDPVGVPVTFTYDKPAEIIKEPIYVSKPRYAVIHLGNGPKSAYNLAFDEPADGNWKVYLDKNQNGDLTDDGDAAFTKKNLVNGTTAYGVNNYVLRASWGTPTEETSHGDYGIGLYQDPLVSNNATMFREAARSGELTVAGKMHKVMLVENDCDALYNKPVVTDATTGKPTETVTGQPVWLLVDTNTTGSFSLARAQTFDVRAPFKIGDSACEATVADDGSSISLAPTTKAAAVLTEPAPKPKPLIPNGPPAPNFSALAWGGGSVGPADYTGKILILDFWATWCGPCQKSMPHIERVFEATRNKNVAVLAVCVWDDKNACTNWMRNNLSKYSFTLAFDPAGKAAANNIAGKLFHVTGIPTTIIIDEYGNIADTIVGYSDGDTRIESALIKLGVQILPEATK